MAVEYWRRPDSLALYFNGAGVTRPGSERCFFTKVRLPNGTYKTTYPGRLDDLNEMLLEFLPRDRSLAVMDVAISSGISTMEWSDHLRAHDLRYEMVGGDLITDALLTSWGNSLALLFDSNRQVPLLLEVGPLTLPVRSDRWLARAVRPVLFPFLRAIAATGQLLGSAVPMAPPVSRRWVHRSIPLVSPELHRQAEIKVVQDDITISGRFPERFDAVRVANLLHRSYFDDEVLARMVRNLRDRLRNGGILAICRTTEDGTNHATIFRRRGDRLISEVSLNGGSEISDLVRTLGSSKNTERCASSL